MGKFTDAIDSWVEETQERMDAVYARFVELVADDLTITTTYGGNLPHKTGNLMRSLLGSTAGMPPQGAPGTTYAGADIGLITAGIAYGTDVWIGFQANYARRMNYGFVGADSLGRVYNQEGFGFIEATVAKAPQLAAQAVAEVKQRAGVI
jgi:hypothetical protein